MICPKQGQSVVYHTLPTTKNGGEVIHPKWSNGGGILPTNFAFKQCARAHACRYSTHALIKIATMPILIIKCTAQTFNG